MYIYDIHKQVPALLTLKPYNQNIFTESLLVIG